MAGIVQIAHPGRMSPAGAGNRPADMEAMCPSSVPVEMGNSWIDKLAVKTLLGIPREMTIEDIDRVVADFVRAAKICQAAGFAGVQLHAAVSLPACSVYQSALHLIDGEKQHGFLVSQFLSPNTNRRTDAYGGTPEKRLKLLQRLLEEVRMACPLPFCVGVKLNTGDCAYWPAFLPPRSLSLMQPWVAQKWRTRASRRPRR